MPLRGSEILEALRLLAEKEDLRVCAKESMKGGLITGGAAATGGLIAGPVGILVGSIVGGLSAYFVTKDYKPLPAIIFEMPEKDKEALVTCMRSIFEEVNASDVQLAVAIIVGDAMLKQRCLRELRQFFASQCEMTILD